jgi:Mg-chelatase subunit ChlD
VKAYILLDRSGSMQTRWTETVGALNAYVAGLAGEKATKKTEVTVVAFDNQDLLLVVRSGVKASDWKPISEAELRPRGMTPLYDAIGKLVATVRQDSPEKATIVIITDGAENGSRELKKDAAKSMLDEMRAKQLDVVFIGADFDAFAQGSGLGNAAGSTIIMKSGSYGDAMSVLATRSMAYAAGGAVASFSDADRKRAAGIKA